MIKIFRKIRLDALPEINSGQVSRKLIPKYLTYAIGEIILVVINASERPVRDKTRVENNDIGQNPVPLGTAYKTT